MKAYSVAYSVVEAGLAWTQEHWIGSPAKTTNETETEICNTLSSLKTSASPNKEGSEFLASRTGDSHRQIDTVCVHGGERGTVVARGYESFGVYNSEYQQLSIKLYQYY